MDLEEWEVLPRDASFFDFHGDGGSKQKMMLPLPLSPRAKESEPVPNPDPEPESASQVFFKKMKETEFVDMKMDSPKSQTSSSPVWESPRLESSGKFSFDDDDGDELSSCSSPRMVKVNDDETNGALNLWKWSLHGIGAICSFGFAAATVCIIIFGRNKQLQNQQLRFQIYTDDKRVKQVVQHATRFNDAISAVRGVPIARAQVTFGGYYDAI